MQMMLWRVMTAVSGTERRATPDRSGLLPRTDKDVDCGRRYSSRHHRNDRVEFHDEFDAAARDRSDGIIDEIAMLADAGPSKDIYCVRPIALLWRRNSLGLGLLQQRIPALGPWPPVIMPEQIDAVARIIAFQGENRTTQGRIKCIADSGPSASEFHERVGIAQLFVGVDIRPGKDRSSYPRAPRHKTESRTGANDIEPGLRGGQCVRCKLRIIQCRPRQTA